MKIKEKVSYIIQKLCLKIPNAQKSFFPKKLHKQSGDFVNRKLENTIKKQQKKICGPDGRYTQKKQIFTTKMKKKQCHSKREEEKERGKIIYDSQNNHFADTLVIYTQKDT